MNLKNLLETPPWDWPRDTGKVLRKTLLDRQAPESDRLIAAELSGDLVVIDDAMVEAILTVVCSAAEPEPLRSKAAISLGPVLEQTGIDGFEDNDPDELPISESTFRNIQDMLQAVCGDPSVPKQVRRRALEASVRAPEEWHNDAVARAYATGDPEWVLTAVFCMRWIPGFDREILESLQSSNEEIHFEAVNAAGENELNDAWDHVVALVNNSRTPKPLRLAAIGAVGGIRPSQARDILVDLADSDDEEIAEAADESMMMAEAVAEFEDEEEDGNNKWIN